MKISKKALQLIDKGMTAKTVSKLTETIEQELAAKKFLEENYNYSFIGITNKKNLIFENKGKQKKISPEGFVL